MRALVVSLAALSLCACASWDEQFAQTQHDPNHKQYLTGSRLPHKGRGGPDAIKNVSAQDARDQMRTVMENKPQSQ